MKGMLRSLELFHRKREYLPVDDLVIDIGNVHYKRDIAVEIVTQNSRDHVLPCMVHVRHVVDGGFAAVQ